MANILELILKITSQGTEKLKEVTGDVKKVDEATKTSSKSAGEFGISLGDVGTAMAGLGLAVGARELAEYGVQAYLATDAVNDMTEGLVGLAGSKTVAVGMLDSMAAASQNTITQGNALRLTNKAMIAEIGESPGKMYEFTEAARLLGRAVGENATTSVQAFTQALEFQQPRALRAFGITVDATRVYRDYAASLGKTADELSEVERQTAFTEAAMATMTEKVNELKKGFTATRDPEEELAVAMDNYKISVGQFLQGPGAELLEFFTEAINRATLLNRAMAGDVTAQAELGTKKQIGAFGAQIGGGFIKDTPYMNDIQKQANQIVENKLRLLEKELNDEQSAARIKGETHAVEISSGGSYSGGYGTSGGENYVEWLKRMSEESIKEYDKNTKGAAKAGEDFADKVGKAADDLYDDIQSRIKNALNPSTALAGIDLSSIPGMGNVNGPGENIRRLADMAVNGPTESVMKNMDLIKQSNPDMYNQIFAGGTPQATAQQLLKETEANQHPEYFDFDMILNKVRSEIQGDQQTEAVSKMLTDKLIKEGFSKEQIDKAMGIAKPGQSLVNGIEGDMNSEDGKTKIKGLAKLVANNFTGALPEALKGAGNSLIDAIVAEVIVRLNLGGTGSSTGGGSEWP
jgi:hypothetical protein